MMENVLEWPFFLQVLQYNECVYSLHALDAEMSPCL